MTWDLLFSLLFNSFLSTVSLVSIETSVLTNLLSSTTGIFLLIEFFLGLIIESSVFNLEFLFTEFVNLEEDSSSGNEISISQALNLKFFLQVVCLNSDKIVGEAVLEDDFCAVVG